MSEIALNVYFDHPLYGVINKEWEVPFTFRIPTLPVGDYSIDIWTHGALTLTSHTSSVSIELVGIPMLGISAKPV
jgi:hypothetical protein